MKTNCVGAFAPSSPIIIQQRRKKCKCFQREDFFPSEKIYLFFKNGLDKREFLCYNLVVRAIARTKIAAIAQLVEHMLGKHEVSGPNPDSSSKQPHGANRGVLVFSGGLHKSFSPWQRIGKKAKRGFL